MPLTSWADHVLLGWTHLIVKPALWNQRRHYVFISLILHTYDSRSPLRQLWCLTGLWVVGEHYLWGSLLNILWHLRWFLISEFLQRSPACLEPSGNMVCHLLKVREFSFNTCRSFPLTEISRPSLKPFWLWTIIIKNHLPLIILKVYSDGHMDTWRLPTK